MRVLKFPEYDSDHEVGYSNPNRHIDVWHGQDWNLVGEDRDDAYRKSRSKRP